MKAVHVLLTLAMMLPSPIQAATKKFCLEGEFNLGARFQGMDPSGDEFYATSWCVISDDETERVRFSGAGNSNPDMQGSWTVAYLPPDRVRIVNRDAPPDIEFGGGDIGAEARSVRRLDPRRLLEEYLAHPGRFGNMEVTHSDGRLIRIGTSAELPLRGRVSVNWEWGWLNPARPEARLSVDGTLMFRATGRWELLDEETAEHTWAPTPGDEPVQVPADRWPSRVSMELEELADGVYIVSGVRTGFRHIVVDTSEGLVVGDAPAGWVEFHLLPPADLVPGLGVSGLSEQLIDFLKQELPGRRIAATVLTHHHDDHAGGARAFAAAGAAVYASASIESFLEQALNRPGMPPDRLGELGAPVDVIPVTGPMSIGEAPNMVRLIPLDDGPHVDAMLGVWAAGADQFFVSDVHVPRSDAPSPAGHRARSECWFAGRVAGLLPPEVHVINSHSPVATPVSRLKSYLESDTCRALAR